MKDLVILNYNTASVHFYKVDNNTNIDEEYIKILGFNPDECSWMFAEDIDIIKHKGILK